MSEATLIAVVIGIVMISLVLALLFRGTERRDARREDNALNDGGSPSAGLWSPKHANHARHDNDSGNGDSSDGGGGGGAGD